MRLMTMMGFEEIQLAQNQDGIVRGFDDGKIGDVACVSFLDGLRCKVTELRGDCA